MAGVALVLCSLAFLLLASAYTWAFCKAVMLEERAAREGNAQLAAAARHLEAFLLSLARAAPLVVGPTGAVALVLAITSR